MEISKTDTEKIIAYLEDAAKVFRTLDKPKQQWRGVLMNKLAQKLKRKITPNDDKNK